VYANDFVLHIADRLSLLFRCKEGKENGLGLDWEKQKNLTAHHWLQTSIERGGLKHWAECIMNDAAVLFGTLS
jgi:hypothetical protein